MKAYQIRVLIVFSCMVFLGIQAMQQGPRPVLDAMNNPTKDLFHLLMGEKKVKPEDINALIARGAQRDAGYFTTRWTPLMTAVVGYSVESFFGKAGEIDLDVIRALLADGPDLQRYGITVADLINARGGSTGATALHLAQDIKLLQLLLEKGGNINVQDDTGSTPLHMAMSSNKKDKVLFLLQMGADRTIKNKDMRTPAEIGNNQELKWKVVAYPSRQELQHIIPGMMVFRRGLKQAGAGTGAAKDIGKIVANKFIADLVNQKMAFAQQVFPNIPKENLRIELKRTIIEALKQMPMQKPAEQGPAEEPGPGETSISPWLRWLLGHVEY